MARWGNVVTLVLIAVMTFIVVSGASAQTASRIGYVNSTIGLITGPAI